jgi:hypothetical protein
MEFWKPNNAGQDCFGGKHYIEWLLASEKDALLHPTVSQMFY